MHANDDPPVKTEGFELCDESIGVLEIITQQTAHYWKSLTDKWGVENPLPPWKTSLDGMCDALDESACRNPGQIPSFVERRHEEDALNQEKYSELPYPENQLVSLAHSLITREVFSEEELAQKLQEIRERLST